MEKGKGSTIPQLEMLQMLQSAENLYKEENEKLEQSLRNLAIFEKLGNHQSLLWLADLQSRFGAKDCRASTFSLSYFHTLGRRSYIDVMKLCIHSYISLNEALQSKIADMSGDFKHSMEKNGVLLTFNLEKLKALEKKVNVYESELKRINVKYPPGPACELPVISQEVTALKKLRDDKERLEADLACYHGLSPDLKMASIELSQIKKEYSEIMQKLLTGGKETN